MMTFPLKLVSYDGMKQLDTNDRSVRDNSIDSITSTGIDDTTTTQTVDIVDSAMNRRCKLIDDKHLPLKEKERLLVLKRAYNRECAARARKRGKDLIQELHCRVVELRNDKDELRRSIEPMEEEINKLRRQNKALRALIQANQGMMNDDSMTSCRLGGGSGRIVVNAAAVKAAQGMINFSTVPHHQTIGGGFSTAAAAAALNLYPPPSSLDLACSLLHLQTSHVGGGEGGCGGVNEQMGL